MNMGSFFFLSEEMEKLEDKYVAIIWKNEEENPVGER